MSKHFVYIILYRQLQEKNCSWTIFSPGAKSHVTATTGSSTTASSAVNFSQAIQSAVEKALTQQKEELERGFAEQFEVRSKHVHQLCLQVSNLESKNEVLTEENEKLGR